MRAELNPIAIRIMNFSHFFSLLCLLCIASHAVAQVPSPCGPNPIMANTCATACVICDIDGYTGTNNLEAGGQGFTNFCSTPNDMHYIAFIAGSTTLSIRIDVNNCSNPNSSFWRSLDIGFFQSDDCQTFTGITTCREDLENNDFFVFNTTQDLIVGQHYYLVMDGSFGAICDWTFTVLEGSTQVNSLVQGNEIQQPDLICANQPVEFAIEPQLGATFLRWTIDGSFVSSNVEFEYTFTQSGNYELCISERNTCNEAPLNCSTLTVAPQILHDTTIVICEGDIITYQDIQYDQAGTYPDILIPADIGCDTVATLTLDYGAIFEGDDQYFICQGDTLFLNDSIHFETGVYDHFLLTEKGCDSIVHVALDLVICNMEGVTSATDLLCFGDGPTGSVTFSITAGTPPFIYDYVKVFDEDNSFGSGTISSDFEDVTLNNLTAGTYIITINDGFGNFTILSQQVYEPPAIMSTLSALDYNGYQVSCHGSADGSASVLATGGTEPYAYLWSQGSGTQSMIDNLLAEITYITITDDNGCQYLDTIDLAQPPILDLSAQLTNPDCNGPNTGSIDIMPAIGGVPDYAYSFDNNPFGSQLQYTNLSEDTYKITVRDQNGCIDSIIVDLIAFEIPEISFQDDLTISLGDSILIVPDLNDISIGMTSWQSSDYLDCTNCLTPYAFPVNNTQYTLTVTSSDGCSDQASIQVYVSKSRDFFAANIFSPSTGDVDSKFSILGSRQIAMIDLLEIYDRWGNQLYSARDLDPNTTDRGWDGTFDGDSVNSGVYIWKADIRYLDDHIEEFAGTITLIN